MRKCSQVVFKQYHSMLYLKSERIPKACKEPIQKSKRVGMKQESKSQNRSPKLEGTLEDGIQLLTPQKTT